MIGISDLKTDLTNCSLLKHHKSSILPPPLAIIKTSGFRLVVRVLKYSIPSLISLIAFSPCTVAPYNSIGTENFSKIIPTYVFPDHNISNSHPIRSYKIEFNHF